NRQAFAAAGFDLVRQLRETLGAARRQRHLGPGSGEHLRKMLADAARGAGDQHHLAGDVETRDGNTRVAHDAISLARSRSAYFWILPVEVFGSGPNTTLFGTLKCARLARQKAMISATATSPASGFSVIKAQGVSPHFSSGFATTAASMICGWRYSTSSTSIEEMFSPPEMMMSFERSLISTYPSGCMTARSPERNQPPANASSVAFGFFR